LLRPARFLKKARFQYNTFMLPTIEWKDGRVVMIDQRFLPDREVYVECRDHEQVAEAVESMIIRGAPAIGVAAAMGLALGFDRQAKATGSAAEVFNRISQRLARTRPTARNLFWALERMKSVFLAHWDSDLGALKKRLIDEALAIEKEDTEANRAIGRLGRSLIKDGENILTHCNAGELATAGYGTALGVIRAAHEEGKRVRVYVDETRPFLQGARLTVWELARAGIPYILITDNMAGWLMKQGEISLVLTGADRIARNGDVANKIGTYSAAVLAREHGLPFFVAAPFSTVDMALEHGGQIPIEERDGREVREVGGCRITLPQAPVRNPAFDVTPARYIAAIITEKGIARPPYRNSLSELYGRKK
jgi:methylthioribose-1-phosphate isomerase